MAIKINGTEVIDDSRNITNVGTVDGRNVSSDGSKLDTIENNADVTDGANVGSALTGFTTETSIEGSDIIPVYDATASAWRKATVTNAALAGPKGQKGQTHTHTHAHTHSRQTTQHQHTSDYACAQHDLICHVLSIYFYFCQRACA